MCWPLRPVCPPRPSPCRCSRRSRRRLPRPTRPGQPPAASTRSARPEENDLRRGNTGSAWVRAGTATSSFRCPTARAVRRSLRGETSRACSGAPRASCAWEGRGDWIGYLDQRDLSQYDVDLSLDGSYRSSLNTTWRASGSYNFGNSSSSVVLADQGVLLPLVKTRTLAGAWASPGQLGLRTSLSIDGRVYHTVFDQDDAEALGLVDGQSIRGSASLDRKAGTARHRGDPVRPGEHPGGRANGHGRWGEGLTTSPTSALSSGPTSCLPEAASCWRRAAASRRTASRRAWGNQGISSAGRVTAGRSGGRASPCTRAGR